MRAVAWIRCSPLSESWQTEARPGEAIECEPSVWLVADRSSPPSEKTEARLGEAIGEARRSVPSIPSDVKLPVKSCVNVNGDKVLGRQAVARRRSLTVSEWSQSGLSVGSQHDGNTYTRCLDNCEHVNPLSVLHEEDVNHGVRFDLI